MVRQCLVRIHMVRIRLTGHRQVATTILTGRRLHLEDLTTLTGRRQAMATTLRQGIHRLAMIHIDRHQVTTRTGHLPKAQAIPTVQPAVRPQP